MRQIQLIFLIIQKLSFKKINMAEHKKQHYLAQSYLKGFSAGTYKGVPQIWYTNNKTRELKLSSIKNTAHRSYYYSKQVNEKKYDHQLEKDFSQIERKYPITLKKIKSAITAINLNNKLPKFTHDDHELLCLYIAINMSRIPRFMDWAKTEAEKHNIKMNKLGFAESLASSSQNLSIDALIYFYKNSLPKIIEILKRKNMTIHYIISRKYSFITSDNPVFVYRPEGPNGIIHNDSNIFFPLNSSSVLKLHGQGTQLKFEKIYEQEFIEIINWNVMNNATHEAYGNDPERIILNLDHSWTIKRNNKIVFDKS